MVDVGVDHEDEEAQMNPLYMVNEADSGNRDQQQDN